MKYNTNIMLLIHRVSSFFDRVYRNVRYYRSKIIGKTNIIITKKTLLFKSKINIQKFYHNNKIEISAGSVLRKVTININGNNNHIVLNDKCLLQKDTVIDINGDNNIIELGSDTRLDGVHISVCSSESKLSIGKQSFISLGCSIALYGGKNIFIGDCFLCSKNVKIMNYDGHMIVNNSKQINNPDDIKIGEHVWACYGSMFLKGSVVSRDSVVGAYSIANKKYNVAGSLIVGSPGRIVKSDINWIR